MGVDLEYERRQKKVDTLCQGNTVLNASKGGLTRRRRPEECDTMLPCLGV